MSRLPKTVKQGFHDVDMNEEVRHQRGTRFGHERPAALPSARLGLRVSDISSRANGGASRRSRLTAPLSCLDRSPSASCRQVSSFLRHTGLSHSVDLSDSALFSVLSSPVLRLCTWEATLSLAHPLLSALLDDLDDRLRRFVKHFHLDDAEYARKEEKEMADLEEEDRQTRLALRRTRRHYGEAELQDEEETEEVIQKRKADRAAMGAPKPELVLAILRLQALLLSHCVKPHLFNSTDVSRHTLCCIICEAA